jgi:hypothetical protein
VHDLPVRDLMAIYRFLLYCSQARLDGDQKRLDGDQNDLFAVMFAVMALDQYLQVFEVKVSRKDLTSPVADKILEEVDDEYWRATIKYWRAAIQAASGMSMNDVRTMYTKHLRPNLSLFPDCQRALERLATERRGGLASVWALDKYGVRAFSRFNHEMASHALRSVHGLPLVDLNRFLQYCSMGGGDQNVMFAVMALDQYLKVFEVEAAELTSTADLTLDVERVVDLGWRAAIRAANGMSMHDIRTMYTERLRPNLPSFPDCQRALRRLVTERRGGLAAVWALDRLACANGWTMDEVLGPTNTTPAVRSPAKRLA